MIDFQVPDEVEALRERVASFVRDVAIPAEAEDVGAHGLDDGLRARLQEQARAAGIFTPQASPELGGLGLDMRGLAVVLEEAGYSVLGPQALNCAAPDEGNMHLLDVVATAEQRTRFLEPLVAGRVRSCFAMTEPPPGAGSDPSMLQTTATPDGEGWSVTGRKWFITGADGATFAICMARAPEGPTMFLIDTSSPGWEIVRIVEAMDRTFAGGHAEIAIDDCHVGPEAVLGRVGEGLRYAQVRLAPARLTHCIRWLGAARRAHDTALDYAISREAFGSRLADLGMVQERIAASVIDIETCRLLIWRCAWTLDAGLPAGAASSVAKAHVAEAVGRIIDRAVQICGSHGVSADLPLARLAADVRPFRIYDGPTETHAWSIARRAVRDRERSGAAA
jgi:acyl-CoA dehydrogenase